MPATHASAEVLVAEASRMLGLSTSRTRALLRAGRIPGARRVGRVWRLDRDALVTFATDRAESARARASGRCSETGGQTAPEDTMAPRRAPSSCGVPGSKPLGEDFYRTIAESSHDWVTWRSPDGDYIFCSPSCQQLTGHSPEEFLTHSDLLSHILHPDYLPLWLAHEASHGTDACALEFRIIRPGGSECWIEHICRPIFAQDGSYIGRRSSNRDCTERKQVAARADQLLRQVESLAADLQGERDVMRALMDNAAARLAYLDNELNFVSVNSPYAEALGLSVEQLLGRNYTEFSPQTAPLLHRVRDAGVAEHQSASPLPFLGDGHTRYWDWTIAPVPGCGGATQGLVLSLVDVTEMTRARQHIAELADQAARRAAELDTVFATAVDGIIVYDRDGRIVRMNATAERILGYTEEQKASPIPRRLLPGTLVDTNLEEIPLADFVSARALKGETVLSQVVGLRFRPRPPIWLSFSGAPLVDPDGTISGAVLTFADVRELRHTQELLEAALSHEREQNDRLALLTRELETERQRLAVTLRSIGDGVVATDSEARVTLLNRAAEAMTGWTEREALGRPLAEVLQLFNEATGERIEDPATRVLQSAEPQGLANHTVLVSRDGTRRVLADSAAPIVSEGGRPSGIVLVFQDVTERRHLEEERAKVNKLESLGILAGGIAHDFNNLLTSVLGNITLALMDVADRPQVAEVLAEAERAGERAKTLTQQLLTFAKGGLPVRKPTDLGDVLADAANAALRGRGATLQLDIPSHLWPANVDAGQIGQVIRNLVINADEATAGGGTVTVRAGNVTLGSSSLLPLAPGRYVYFTVEDNGTGIPREIQDRIFDPYFTTKPGGSGIGLSVVYSVVAKHGGHVSVQSEPGRGTTFRVYLPTAPSGDSAMPQPDVAARPRQGRILVMDDESTVRSVAERMLRRLGFDVSTAVDGREAASIYAAAMAVGEPFDAVLLDVYVPRGVGGMDALALLQRVDPTVRAIVCSGYSTDPIISNHAAYGFAAAVAKPYRMQDLMVALDSVLAGGCEPNRASDGRRLSTSQPDESPTKR